MFLKLLDKLGKIVLSKYLYGQESNTETFMVIDIDGKGR
jgi:hypothetical protein